MLQKIAKIITNNFGLKILAVVISVVFWLVIVNVEDPEKTLTFTVQVNIENADYLTNQGKTYEILNGSDTTPAAISSAAPIARYFIFPFRFLIFLLHLFYQQ